MIDKIQEKCYLTASIKTMNFAKNFVDFLLKNGKILFLTFLFLVIFGAISVSSLQRQGFPDVLVNVASVQVVYPNASAQQIESDVIIPLEEAVAGVDDVTEYQSTASDNFGMIFVTIDQKADLEKSVTNIRSAVDSVVLPENSNDPEVVQFSIAGAGEIMVGVSGYTNEWDLFDAGDLYEQKLRSIDGVRKVTAINEITPEIRITWDAETIAELGLNRDLLEQVIEGLDFAAPAGSYTENEESVSVLVSRSIDSVQELKRTEVAPGIALEDLGTFEIVLNNNDKYNRVGFDRDGEFTVERALLYGISLDKDADILVVDDAIEELNSQLTEEKVGEAEEKGTDITGNAPVFLTVYSQADSTRQQIGEIVSSIFGQKIEGIGAAGYIGYLVGGLGLVVILLLIFMNLRVAIMAALAIPMSLFIAAIYLNLAGIDLNTLVLFAMVLVIGLVIDPTIVFLESMQRNIEKGLSGRDAAVETVRTVGLGVFLAVATNILVFVPFGLVSGFFGEIIKFIPATVIPAMIASMVVPMVFFLPASTKLLKRSKKATNDPDDLGASWKLGQWTAAIVKRLLKDGFWNAVLRFVVFTVVMALPFVTIGATLGTGTVEVVQFAEADDADFMMIQGDLPNTWNFEKAVYDIVVPVQGELAKVEEIKTFFYYEQSGNDFTIFVELLPMKDREDADLRKANDVANAINDAIDQLNLDADIFASVSSEGPPQEANPVKVRIFDENSEVLATASEDVKSFLTSQEEVIRVADNSSEGNSGGTSVLNLNTQNLINLNAFTVYGAVSGRLSEQSLADMQLDGYTYQIVTNTNDTVDSSEELLNTEIIVESQDPRIPAQVLTVADLVENVGELESTQIQRVNGKKFIEISAGLSEDANLIEVQTRLEDYLSEEKIADLGLSEDAVSFEGEADSIAESFGDLFAALAVAIFLIYLLLVGFFRSFIEPFIILFAVPLGLVGVFLAIAATTGQLGFLELIGVIAMAGIVVNVTILLIDYANQLQREGMALNDAISTAIGVRLRPIILTQLTAFGSLVPLVYLSPFWKGLAAAIIFGIASSAVLSIFATPILYKWTHTLGKIPGKIATKFRS